MPAETYTNKEQREKRTEEFVKKHQRKRLLAVLSGVLKDATNAQNLLVEYFSGHNYELKSMQAVVVDMPEKPNLQLVVTYEKEGVKQEKRYDLNAGTNQIQERLPIPKDSFLTVTLSMNDDMVVPKVYFTADVII